MTVATTTCQNCKRAPAVHGCTGRHLSQVVQPMRPVGSFLPRFKQHRRVTRNLRIIHHRNVCIDNTALKDDSPHETQHAIPSRDFSLCNLVLRLFIIRACAACMTLLPSPTRLPPVSEPRTPRAQLAADPAPVFAGSTASCTVTRVSRLTTDLHLCITRVRVVRHCCCVCSRGNSSDDA